MGVGNFDYLFILDLLLRICIKLYYDRFGRKFRSYLVQWFLNLDKYQNYLGILFKIEIFRLQFIEILIWQVGVEFENLQFLKLIEFNFLFIIEFFFIIFWISDLLILLKVKVLCILNGRNCIFFLKKFGYVVLCQRFLKQ